jgi:hypothetical protein
MRVIATIVEVMDCQTGEGMRGCLLDYIVRYSAPLASSIDNLHVRIVSKLIVMNVAMIAPSDRHAICPRFGAGVLGIPVVVHHLIRELKE